MSQYVTICHNINIAPYFTSDKCYPECAPASIARCPGCHFPMCDAACSAGAEHALECGLMQQRGVRAGVSAGMGNEQWSTFSPNLNYLNLPCKRFNFNILIAGYFYTFLLRKAYTEKNLVECGQCPKDLDPLGQEEFFLSLNCAVAQDVIIAPIHTRKVHILKLVRVKSC